MLASIAPKQGITHANEIVETPAIVRQILKQTQAEEQARNEQECDPVLPERPGNCARKYIQEHLEGHSQILPPRTGNSEPRNRRF